MIKNVLLSKPIGTPRFVALAALLIIGESFCFGEIIPANRLTNWRANVGVEGGIPNSSNMTVYTTVTVVQGTAGINNALVACPSNQVVQLQAGTYLITSLLNFTKNGVVLRGAGAGKTILQLAGFPSGLSLMGTSRYDDKAVGANPPAHVANWTGGYAQGSTSITLDSVAGLTPGKLICLDQVNDNNDVVAFQCSYCGRGPSQRSQEQFVKVKAINGNTVTLSSPIYMPTWQASQAPQAWWQDGTVLEMIGVENLTINGLGGGHPGDGYSANIFMTSIYNCWVKNVESLYGGGVCHLNPLGGVVRCEFRHNSFRHNRGNEHMSYGILYFASSGCWFEDNSFEDVVAPFTGGACSSGNAITYNFATNSPYIVSGSGVNYQSQLITTHDAHQTMLLVEGNYANGFYGDYYHGSMGYATLYRNRFTGFDRGATPNAWCITLDPRNRNVNIVGNVLGTPGWTTAYSSCGNQNVFSFGCGAKIPVADDPMVLSTAYLHGNYDVVNRSVSWAPNNPDHTLAPSLLYSDKPGWFGNLTWPPFNPDNGAAIAASVSGCTNIPAGYRFIFGVDPPGVTFGTNQNQSPVPSPGANPASGNAPLTVVFSSAGSYDPEGAPLTFLWNFGDGSTATSSNATHTYTTVGFYTASLTVLDGTNSTVSAGIAISAAPPGGYKYIWPLGDSITRGYNQPGGYRLPLYQLLTNSGMSPVFVGTLNDSPVPGLPFCDHDGWAGYEIGEIAANLQAWMSTIHTPDYVLLMIGLNDFRHNTDVQHATNRLENLIVQISTNVPNATIIVADLNPWTNLEPTNSVMEVWYNPYIPGVVSRQAALGRKVSLCDMRGKLFASTDLQADNTHPTQLGSNKIATNWFSVLQPETKPLPPQRTRELGRIP